MQFIEQLFEGAFYVGLVIFIVVVIALLSRIRNRQPPADPSDEA